MQPYCQKRTYLVFEVVIILQRYGGEDQMTLHSFFRVHNHFAWMRRRTRAVTPPLTRIAPLDPSYTLPRLTREQRCKWLHRQKDLLHELLHPELYQVPPNWDPRVQFILASDPSTVTERDFIDCVELYLEEIVLRVATMRQGILYEYGPVSPNAFFQKLNEWSTTRMRSESEIPRLTWSHMNDAARNDGKDIITIYTGQECFFIPLDVTRVRVKHSVRAIKE